MRADAKGAVSGSRPIAGRDKGRLTLPDVDDFVTAGGPRRAARQPYRTLP